MYVCGFVGASHLYNGDSSKTHLGVKFEWKASDYPAKERGLNMHKEKKKASVKKKKRDHFKAVICKHAKIC